MRYWWVNQNQTYRAEVQGGFLWSPKTRTDGARNPFYDSMRLVQPGDEIFSFCDTYIKAVGVVMRAAEMSPKPDFGNVGLNWSAEGWLVEVEFQTLSNPFRPKDHIDQLRPFLPPKYSPLQSNGNGVQSIYLTEVPEPLAYVLRVLIDADDLKPITELSEDLGTYVAEQSEDRDEIVIQRTDIGETEKLQLIRARRGQGLFRANVRLTEKFCRVTKVDDPRHLRASHIKPWKQSSDEEKVNGCNGLLLAPHVDHLFDGGFISFKSEGNLIISPKLDRAVLKKWSIVPDMNVGNFGNEQSRFLEYHRDIILLK